MLWGEASGKESMGELEKLKTRTYGLASYKSLPQQTKDFSSHTQQIILILFCVPQLERSSGKNTKSPKPRSTLVFPGLPLSISSPAVGEVSLKVTHRSHPCVTLLWPQHSSHCRERSTQTTFTPEITGPFLMSKVRKPSWWHHSEFPKSTWRGIKGTTLLLIPKLGFVAPRIPKLCFSHTLFPGLPLEMIPGRWGGKYPLCETKEATKL